MYPNLIHKYTCTGLPALSFSSSHPAFPLCIQMAAGCSQPREGDVHSISRCHTVYYSLQAQISSPASDSSLTCDLLLYSALSGPAVSPLPPVDTAAALQPGY